jgi:GNAT superfamily N-acetyltransferase
MGLRLLLLLLSRHKQGGLETATREANRLAARRMIEQGQMRGLLAYAGETPVGWCHFDRLANLPGAPVFYPELASKDGESAAIVCFTVAQGWRGQGIAAALLKKALEDLKASGVKGVEAYRCLTTIPRSTTIWGPCGYMRARALCR